MGRVWVNGHWRNRPSRRRKNIEQAAGSGCLALLFLIGIAFVLLLVLCQAASAHPGFTGSIFVLAVAGIIGYFVHKWKRAKEQRDLQAYQQYMAQVQAQNVAAAEHQQMVYREQQRQMQNQREYELRRERQRQEYELKREQIKTLGGMLMLTPTEFEEVIGQMLASKGLQNVRRVGGSGDLSVDLLATDTHGNRVVVQCKRYNPGRSISSPELQKFIGMMFVQHKAQKGIFVTTSTFTQPAIDLAKDNNIVLIDGNALVRLMQSMTM